MRITRQSNRPAGQRPALDSRPSALRSAGFTLVELMVVITVMAILITLLVAVLGRMGQQAKEAATMATIKKIHAQLEQRLEAFDREIRQRGEFRFHVDTTLKQSYGGSTEAREILALKDFKRRYFPQSYSDLNVNIPGLAPHSFPGSSTANSSQLLYWILTQDDVFGAATVDAGEFLASEVAERDGLMEFVDAWGEPLRFYRWPTRLIRPGGCLVTRLADDVTAAATTLDVDPDLNFQGPWPSDIIVGSSDSLERMTVSNYSSAQFTISQRGVGGTIAQAHSAGELVRQAPDTATCGLLISGMSLTALDGDPDDPYGLVSGLLNESNYHTIHTYHAPLIVSAGPDGVLGLAEPESAAGRLAQPTDVGALTDNITNRNQRTGN